MFDAVPYFISKGVKEKANCKWEAPYPSLPSEKRQLEISGKI